MVTLFDEYFHIFFTISKMHYRTFWLISLACFSLAGCRRERIETYQIPKESPPRVTAPAGAVKEIEWKVPEGWQEQSPSSMRVGSFLVKGPAGRQADVSVIPLAGEAGGDLFNINRWRGQINLGPISASELPHQSQTIMPAGRKMLLVEFANRNRRLVAAIYHREGRTWFFKMTGEDATVKSAKTSFMEFLNTLQFHEH